MYVQTDNYENTEDTKAPHYGHLRPRKHITQ